MTNTTMPSFTSGNTIQQAVGVVQLDTNGNPIGGSGYPSYTVIVGPSGNQSTVNSDGSQNVQPIQGAVTNLTLVSGIPLAIDLRTYSGAKLEISGLSADSLAVNQSMDGTVWCTAYLMKDDGTAPFAATAITGTSGNAGYSVYGFRGEIQVTRTGSSDTNLTVKVKGTN